MRNISKPHQTPLKPYGTIQKQTEAINETQDQSGPKSCPTGTIRTDHQDSYWESEYQNGFSTFLLLEYQQLSGKMHQESYWFSEYQQGFITFLLLQQQLKYFFGTKIFSEQKSFFGLKFFGLKIFFELKKKFQTNKIFWIKNFFGTKIFLEPEIFLRLKILTDQQVFQTKSFSSQKYFCTKNFFGSKVFGHFFDEKIILDQTFLFFGPKIFFGPKSFLQTKD